MRTRVAVAVVLLLGLVWVACSSDLATGIAARAPRAVPAAHDVAGQGLDLGLTLSAPITAHALAGASIPTTAGDLAVAFVAFVTRASASDGSGTGTALDRSAPAPADSNGAEDVFLAAVVNLERTISGRAAPATFVQGLASVMRDPRCIRCHSFHYPGGWRENGHVADLRPGSNENCGDCHTAAASLVPGRELTRIAWFAPDPGATRNPTQDFRGKSDRDLFDLARSVADPRGHLRDDDKIQWAIEHGQVPFRGGSEGGAVPMTLAQWRDLVEAWALDNTFFFSTDSATKDVVLVSQRAAGATSAGNGASSAPSVAFEPNPAFNPNNLAAAPAGWAHVAFASSATDLAAGVTVTKRDVYRARVEVWLAANGVVDLRAQPVNNVLVSRTAAGATGGNADSDRPSISADGALVAFDSLATDLVAGFAPGNGPAAPDVFVRDMVGASTRLLSRSVASATQGGDGGAFRPVVSATGGIVAFEAEATDLVSGDTNAAIDVFLANAAGPVVVARASVRTDGTQGTGGFCSEPSVWVDPGSGEAWVAFRSTKTDLDGSAPGASAGVYLRRTGPTPRTLRLGGSAAAEKPVVAPDGSRIAFVSAGIDLDALRPDGNALADVFTFDFAGFRANGTLAHRRASLAVTGADADGVSALPRFAGFRNFAGTFQTDALLSFTTTATNVGRSPGSDVVLQFLIDRSTPRTVAQFSGAPLTGTAPLTVQFADLSSNATTWAWTFGDGGQGSTERNPSRVYANPGSYTVALTVTGPGGNSTITKPGYVTVNAAPPTFTQIHASYFQGTCTGCHGASGGLSLARNVAWGNLVNANSTQCAGRKRVVAGSAATSQLLEVLTGTGCHPNHTGGTLGAQAIADITAWINAGALDN